MEAVWVDVQAVPGGSTESGLQVVPGGSSLG